MSDNNYKSFSIHLKSSQFKHKIIRGVFDYKHLENMLFILQNDAYNSKNKELFKLLKNKVTMKAVLSQNSGGDKTKESIQFVNDSLKNNELFQSMLLHCEKLNDKNCSMIVERTNANWKTYFTQNEEYFKNPSLFAKKYGSSGKPKTPKPKKLNRINRTSLPLEESKWSLTTRKKGRNKTFLNLTLNKKQIKIPLRHHGFIAQIGIKNINNAKLSFSNNSIYIDFTYIENKVEKESKTPKKSKKKDGNKASIDIGINNLLSLFVHDKKTKSLLYDGRKLKSKNTKFNRFNAKLDESIANEAIEFKANKKGDKYAISWTQKGLRLKKFKTFLIEKRKRYFDNEFHKLSKNVTQFLIQNNVKDLVISKNLSFAKTEGNITLSKKVKQSFMHIPFGMLLNRIEEKCTLKGINIHTINEAYTSKTSCLSKNINNILKLKNNKKLTTTDYGGSRVARGMFVDKASEKAINADLNGAVNHIKIQFPKVKLDYLNENLFKLCNPIKIKSNNDFKRLLAA